KLIKHLDIKAPQFAMIGNSLKSDILPVLSIGGHGFHVPYHVTWTHEQIDFTIEHEHFIELKVINDILKYL
ncbi:MAG: HAD family hydrolase, partial [Bacteroidetes bacterium]|nr:HAD family hydrolase [Bacteroidota bacterium]